MRSRYLIYPLAEDDIVVDDFALPEFWPRDTGFDVGWNRTAERQYEERQQMQIDEDYYDHLQWRPDDARDLMERGQAPLVFNEARQIIDWISGTEKRMRKEHKVLPREPNDECGAELKTKLIQYTDDVNMSRF